MQIILVHTMTKLYYSSPGCCREMQGDAKLHKPSRNGMFRDPPEWGKQMKDWYYVKTTIYQSLESPKRGK